MNFILFLKYGSHSEWNMFTAILKVPKHENFILVDFRDFFNKQTPWNSDPVDMILKIICNGQALMYRV